MIDPADGTLGDRLREVIDALADGDICDDTIRESLAGVLFDLNEELEGWGPKEERPPIVLCGSLGRVRGQAPCDRPERHKGDCSWMATVYKRRAREWEATAAAAQTVQAKLTTTRNELAAERRRATAAELALEAQRRRWFRRRQEERG